MKYFKSEKCWYPPQKVTPEVAGHSETLSPSTEKTPQKDSKSIILQNSRITMGKTNTVDISFVPKTVGFTNGAGHLLCLNILHIIPVITSLKIRVCLRFGGNQPPPAS